MIDKVAQQGGIVASDFGQKRLPDGRVVKFTLEARLVHTDSGRAQKLR